jgi:hypothetical protein
MLSPQRSRTNADGPRCEPVLTLSWVSSARAAGKSSTRYGDFVTTSATIRRIPPAALLTAVVRRLHLPSDNVLIPTTPRDRLPCGPPTLPHGSERDITREHFEGGAKLANSHGGRQHHRHSATPPRVARTAPRATRVSLLDGRRHSVRHDSRRHVVGTRRPHLVAAVA